MFGVYNSKYAKNVTPAGVSNTYSGLEPSYQPFKKINSKENAKNGNEVQTDQNRASEVEDMKRTLKKGFGVNNQQMFNDAMDTKSGQFFKKGKKSQEKDVDDFEEKQTLKQSKKVTINEMDSEDDSNYMDVTEDDFADENIQVYFKNGQLFDEQKLAEGIQKNLDFEQGNEPIDWHNLYLDQQEQRKYEYLKHQYETYLKNRISKTKKSQNFEEKVDQVEDPNTKIDNLYKEWRFSKQKFPKAYHKFISEFLTEDEMRKTSQPKLPNLIDQNILTTDLRILDPITLHAGTQPKNINSLPFKPHSKARTINLLLSNQPRADESQFEVFETPGNNSFKAPNIKLQSVVKIQSWIRGHRSRKETKDLRFLFRNRKVNPELEAFTYAHTNLFKQQAEFNPVTMLNTGAFNSTNFRAQDMNSEVPEQMRGTANFNMDLQTVGEEKYYDQRLEKDLDQLKNIVILDKDLLNFKNQLKREYPKIKSQSVKYSYIPDKKLVKNQPSLIENLLVARKDHLKPEIFLNKPKRGRRIFDILYRKNKRGLANNGSQFQLDNLDWTVEGSKSKDLRKSQIAKLKFLKKKSSKKFKDYRASVDTFKYSKDGSVSDAGGIDDPFANQSYKFTDRSHRSQKYNHSRSVAFKNSVESDIPMELNMGEQSIGDNLQDESIPMEMDFDNFDNQASEEDSDGVIRFSNSNSAGNPNPTIPFKN